MIGEWLGENMHGRGIKIDYSNSLMTVGFWDEGELKIDYEYIKVKF